ncbi:LTA synthase family protein [Liquorilactobacillus aquaticus]|nr:alkaline phosphatase family protein [Liquorilactobacillus aquaticus]
MLKLVRSYKNMMPFTITILFIIYQLLSSAVTPPLIGEQPYRYLLYWSLFVFSSTAVNLIPLYMGALARRNPHPIRNLGKIVFFFFSIGISGILLALLLFKSFAARDIWLLFFPLSHNDFPFAASLLVWYILGYRISTYLDSLSANNKHSIMLFLMWLFVAMPFIFNKPLWGINSASSLVWTGFLFILGNYFSDSRSYSKKYYLKYAGLFLLSLLALVLFLKIAPISQTPGNLDSRFFSSYAVIPFILSLCLFNIFKKSFTITTSAIKHHAYSSWMIFTAVIFTSLPIFNYRLKTNYMIANKLSLVSWLKELIVCSGIILLIVICLTLLFNRLARLSLISRRLEKISPKQLSDVYNFTPFVKKMIKNNKRLIFSFIWGAVLTIIQFWSVQLATNRLTINLLKQTLLTSQNQILLNVLIFLTLFIALYALINRYTYSLFIATGISIFISISEYLKIKMRNEPILPADLSMITSIDELAKMIGNFALYGIIALLIVLTVSSILITLKFERNYHNRFHSWRKRLLTLLFSGIILFFSLGISDKSSVSSIIQGAFSVQNIAWDATRNAQLNGPVLQFFSGLSPSIMPEPSGYSKSKIAQITKKYSAEAHKINKTRKNSLNNQTVIFVLSESYSDPNRVPNLKVTPNPIPYLTSLKKQTTSGLMLSTGYGGGTANLEWQSLTGLSYSNLSSTLSLPYYQIVPQQKSAPAFTDLFKNKVAIHPFTATFYNRINVFKKFGFQKFYYVGSKDKLTYTQKLDNSTMISDRSAYNETIKQARKYRKGSTFIQLTTMQNHQPYNDFYTSSKYKISGSAVNDADKQKLQTYSQGLNYTDWALRSFIRKINKINRPVTLVWYGDHLPGLYSGDSMSKYGLQLHQTDYFIYSNQEASKLKQNIASPYQFPALSLAAGNNKVSPYYALLTKVSADLPAMNTNPSFDGEKNNSYNIFVSQANKIVQKKSLSKKQKELLHDYLLIQYDLTAGKQYSATWAQQKVK